MTEEHGKLIEAIARAICANTGGYNWDCAPDDLKSDCFGDAQAALTAITEAGYRIIPPPITGEDAVVGAEIERLERAMISAAQGDGE